MQIIVHGNASRSAIQRLASALAGFGATAPFPASSPGVPKKCEPPFTPDSALISKIPTAPMTKLPSENAISRRKGGSVR